MTRRWLVIALLLSVGVNVGILATLAVERFRGGAGPSDGAAAPAESGAGDPAAPVEGTGSATGAFPETGAGPGPGRRAGPFPGRGGPPGAGPFSEPPEGVRREIERRLDALADRLDLQGDERREFLELQRRFFRETFLQRQQVAAHQRALRLELTAPEPDRERLSEIVDDLETARRSLDRALVDSVVASRELLAPAQEREYLRFLGRLRAAGEGPRGGGSPGGPVPRRRPPGR